MENERATSGGLLSFLASVRDRISPLSAKQGEEGENDQGREEARRNEAVAFVNDEFTRRQKDRQPFELAWRLSMAFLEGNQNVMLNEYQNDLIEVQPVAWWQERECFNHIGPIIETRKARLTRMHPVLKCRPGTSDLSDIRSAKTSSNLLQYVYNDKKVRGKVSEAIGWAEPTGVGFFKNIWNPDAGRIIMRLEEQMAMQMEEQAPAGIIGGLPGTQIQRGQEQAGPELSDVMESLVPGEDGEYTEAEAAGEISPPELGMMQDPEVVSSEQIREGDLEVVAVSPWEIFPDSPFRNGIEACRSMIHARAFHVDEIEEIWGKKVSTENVAAVFPLMNMHSTSGNGPGSMSGGMGSASSLKDHAIVKEYWELPSKKHPRGRLIIVANDTMLYYGDLPWKAGENGEYALPFTMFSVEERPGIFWGRPVVERLIPLQRRYNALRNRKAEYLKRVALGVLFVEEGSVDKDEVADEMLSPGAVIPYARGSKAPEFARQESLPHSFEVEMESILQEFNQISGVSELSRQSKADSGLKSGVALQIALEQDDTRLAQTAANIEEFLMESGKQWLRLYKQYANTPRILRTIGRNNVAEAISWTGADIQSDDVIIEPYSALAESPAQRRQMVYDFLMAGLFNDPETGKMSKTMQSKIFEMLEFGTWEEGEGHVELQVSKAERENIGMAEGQAAGIADYDDHIVHIATHNRERLTAEFEALALSNPAVAELYALHVGEHENAIAEEQQQQMMMMQAMGGGGGGPMPGAPQPGIALRKQQVDMGGPQG